MIDRDHARRLGRVLKAHRLEAGLTREQVAKHLGLKHGNSVAHVEAGAQALKVSHLLPVAALYGTTAQGLLDLAEKVRGGGETK